MYLSNSFETYFLLIFASTGNILGSMTNWYLGKKISIFQNRKWFPVSPAQLNRSQKYFQKYGLWSLLLAWVPVIGDPLTLLAGVLKVRFSVFFHFGEYF
jgi:membrane protein YqaA with SNARE-associated domain